MSEQQKREMLTLWASIADLYGKSKELAGIMAKMSLQEGLTANQVADAWREWMRQGKSTMPTFGDLLKILKPESNTSARQLATQLASMLPALIAKHGYYWANGEWCNGSGPFFEGQDGVKYSSFREALESYLGPCARLLESSWSELCANWDDNQTANYAQWRDRFESELAAGPESMRQIVAKLTRQALRTESQALVARTQNLIVSKSGNEALLPDKQQKKEDIMKLSNAFSLNMLDFSRPARFEARELDLSEVKAALAGGFESFIGHSDLAVLVGQLLGIDIPVNRATLKLSPGDSLIVAQYFGPRLPEGTTVLPEGAEIKFIKVKVSVVT